MNDHNKPDAKAPGWKTFITSQNIFHDVAHGTGNLQAVNTSSAFPPEWIVQGKGEGKRQSRTIWVEQLDIKAMFYYDGQNTPTDANITTQMCYLYVVLDNSPKYDAVTHTLNTTAAEVWEGLGVAAVEGYITTFPTAYNEERFTILKEIPVKLEPTTVFQDAGPPIIQYANALHYVQASVPCHYYATFLPTSASNAIGPITNSLSIWIKYWNADWSNDATTVNISTRLRYLDQPGEFAAV